MENMKLLLRSVLISKLFIHQRQQIATISNTAFYHKIAVY